MSECLGDWLDHSFSVCLHHDKEIRTGLLEVEKVAFLSTYMRHLSSVARKSVFGVFDLVR